MRGTGESWIHELLLSAIELFHKKRSLLSSSTTHNVESSRASGEQETAQSAVSECPTKRSLNWGVFSAKVQETNAWRNARLRFVCTLGEAVKCGYTRYRRLFLADRGVLMLRTPTDTFTSSPSIADHTSKQTEIVGNVGATGNVMTTFVVTTHGTSNSNTSDPPPTFVSQVMTGNARPDSPTTKGLSTLVQDHVTWQRIEEFPARGRRDDSSGSAVEHSPFRRISIPAGWRSFPRWSLGNRPRPLSPCGPTKDLTRR